MRDGLPHPISEGISDGTEGKNHMTVLTTTYKAVEETEECAQHLCSQLELGDA